MDIPNNNNDVWFREYATEYALNNELNKRIIYLESALVEIEKAMGLYNDDPYRHASNCIASMREIARTALEGTWQPCDNW